MKRNIYITLLLGAVLMLSCTSKKDSAEALTYISNSGEIFYTSYHIKYEYSKSLEKEILDELERFELSLNPFRENTIITKINENITVLIYLIGCILVI